VGEIEPKEDDAGRFDDPDGQFLTLYCATSAEGALGEKIAAFAFNPRVARRIETFLESEPDAVAAPEGLSPVLDRETVESFNWLLAWAPAEPKARFIDLWHWEPVPRSCQLLRGYSGASLWASCWTYGRCLMSAAGSPVGWQAFFGSPQQTAMGSYTPPASATTAAFRPDGSAGRYGNRSRSTPSWLTLIE
jgi:hypothetical protein